MLKIVGQGWAEIKIGNKVICKASDLTQLPLDFLKALYDYLNVEDFKEKRFSSSVYVDLEGDALNFVFSNWDDDKPHVFMIYSAPTESDFAVKTFDVEPLSLARELVDDIEKDFDDWAKWCDEKDLAYWLNKLKSALKTIEQ